MKKFRNHLLLSVFVLLHSIVVGQVNSKSQLPANLQNGLVAYYPFNGNAGDVSGNNFNGTPTAISFTTDRYGNSLSAGNFEKAKSSNLFVSANSSFEPKSYSYSVWINTRVIQNGSLGSNSAQVIIAYTPANWSKAAAYGAGLTIVDNSVLSLSQWTPSTSWQYTQTSPGTIKINTWYHVAATYDSATGEQKHYLNGVLINTLKSKLEYSGQIGFSVGASRENDIIGTLSNFFEGKIDDVMFYNRALSSNEITQLYTVVFCQPGQGITINPLQDTTRVCGTSLTLDAGAGFSTYSWNTGATTQSITPTQSGFYKVTVTNSNGCSASDSTYLSMVKAKIIQRDTAICKGTSITLNVDSSFVGSTAATKSMLPANLQNGLLAYYPFNGNANDESGNGYNGNVFGANLTSDRFGYTNSAYNFNGTSSYISTADIDLSTEMTISVWVKPSSLIGALVDKSKDASSNSGYTFLYNNNLNAGVPLHGLYAHVGWSGITQNNIFPSPAVGLQSNIWHHCILTYKSGNAKIYLNGNLITNQSGINPITQNNELLLFGKSVWNGNFLKGDLDDVMIFNRELTSSEINQIYNYQSTIWSTGSKTNSITVSPTQTTKYYVTVSDGITSCQDSITVTVNDPKAFNPLQDTTRACGATTSLDAGVATTYSWNTGATTRTITPTTSGFYKVTINNGSSCVVSDSTYLSMVKAKIIQRDTAICKGASITLNIDSSFVGSTAATKTMLPSNLQNGLVAYYPFNGNANDESGNGNNGIVTGAVLSRDRFGTSNSSYFFSTSSWTPGNRSNEIYIPYSSILNTRSITISSWIKPSKFVIGAETIINRYEGGYSNPNSQVWVFGIYDNNANLNPNVLAPSNNNSQQLVSIIGPQLNVNQWSLVSMKFDGTNLNLYVNGKLVASKAAPSGFQLNTSSNSGLSIGVSRQANGFWQPYDGDIDDILIWNRALSDAEVNQLYSSQSVSWSTGSKTNSITVTPTQTTKYYVTVSDGITSCQDSITVTVNDPKGFNPLQDTIRLCGTSITLDAGVAAIYSWNNGATTRTITPTTSGFYKITINNGSSCVMSDSTYLSMVKAKILQRDTTICKGTSLNIIADSTSLKISQWTKVSAQADFYTRILKTNNGKYLSGAQISSRLYASDSLFNFTPVSSNLTTHNLSVGKDRVGNIYFGTGHQGIFKSTDNGINWTYNTASGYGCGNLDFETDSQNNLYTAVGGYLRGLYVSKDGGNTWQNTFPGIDFTDIEFFSLYNKIFIISGGKIWYSSNQGGIWNAINGQPFSSNTTLVKSFNGKVYVFSNTGDIYVSNDGGLNWTYFSKIPITSSPSTYLNDAVFVNDKIIYASIDQNGIFQSLDNGVSWKLLQDGISGSPHYLYYEGNTLLATTSNGIYKINVFNSLTKVRWSTGDTTNSITVKPLKTTTYYVTVSDGITSCQDSVQIRVTSADTSVSVLDVPSVCSKGAVGVRMQAADSLNYTWLKDGLAVSGATSKSFSATTMGNYAVAIKNALGCTDTSRLIRVGLDSMSMGGKIISPVAVCSKSNAVGLKLGGYRGSIQWQSSLDSISYTDIKGATSDSVYVQNVLKKTFFRAIAKNGVCMSDTSGSSSVRYVDIKPAFNVNTVAQCLESNRFIMTNASSVNDSTLSYKWEFGDSTYSYAVSPSTAYKTSGSFRVILNAISVYGCTDTVGKAIRLYATPTKPSIALSGKTSICSIDTLTMTSTDNFKYQWFKNGTQLVSDTLKTYKASLAGIYQVRGNSVEGCVGPLSDSVKVVVTASPLKPVVADTTYCLGSAAKLLSAVILKSHTGMWYTLAVGDTAKSDGIIPKVNVVGKTDYYVSQRSDSTGCESPRSKITVTVGPMPVKPVIKWQGGSFSTDTGYVSYGWIADNKLVSSGLSYIYKPTIAGMYKVRVANIYGCADTSAAFNLVVTAVTTAGGVGNTARNMRVYPNPTSADLWFDAGLMPMKPMTLRVFDNRGRLVYQTVTRERLTKLRWPGMVSGNYMIEAVDGLMRKTLRVVKE